MSSCGSDITKLYVVQPGPADIYTTGGILNGQTLVFDRIDALSAYTIDVSSLGDFYVNITGDTMTGPLYINSNLIVSGDTILSSVSATTYYGDGSNLTGISTIDSYMTGGTYNNGSIIFSGSGVFSNVTVDVSALIDDTNYYVTGSTLNGNNLELGRNGGLPTLTTDLSSINTDNYVSGGTYSNGNLYFSGTSGNQTFSIDVSALIDDTNSYVTGGTVSGTNLVLGRNGGLPDVTIDTSAYLDNTDNFVTGGTMVGNILVLNRTDALSAVTVDMSQFIDDTNFYVTGFTYNDANTFTISQNNGTSYSSSINTVTGLTFNNGDATFVGYANIVNPGYIQMDVTYTGNTIVEGRMYWDENNQTISVGMHNEAFLQLGQETYYLIKNQSGATIQNGRVVRAAGTLGNSGRILGEYMIADGSIGPKFTLGVATQDILNGDDGYVTEFGLVRGINTTGSLYGETWNDGDVLWVSPTIQGGLTNVEPTAPDLHIEMAIVIKADVKGSIFVRPHRYPISHDIQDMGWLGGTESHLDIIQWNGSLGYFELTNTPTFNSISATTYYGDGSNLTGISDNNSYVTGMTFNNTTYDLTLFRNDGLPNITSNLGALASDIFVMSGVYDPSTGIITYSYNSGSTFQVSGFTTGMTDSYTTNAYLNDNQIRFDNNIQGTNFYNVDLNPLLSGKTNNSDFYSYTASTESILNSKVDNTTFTSYTADTQNILNTKIDNGINVGGGNEVFSGITGTDIYFRTLSGGSNTTLTTVNDVIKIDVSIPADTNSYVTGGTVSGTDLILGRNGGLSDVIIDTSAYFDNTNYYVTGSTLNGNTLELGRNGGLPTLTTDLSQFIDNTDNYVTGGTMIGNTLVLNRTNALSAVTVDMSQFADDTNFYVTGFTYNNSNQLTLGRNGGLSDLSVSINEMTGLTVNGNTTLSGLTTVYGDTPTSAAIQPGVNNTYDLGAPSFRWREVFSTNVDISNALSTEFLYVNNTSSFNGDVDITGNTTNVGNLLVVGDVSGNTFYGDGSNLTGIVSTDYYTTGVTLNGNTLVFNRNDTLSAYTVDLSSITTSGGTGGVNYYTTGVTLNGNTLVFSRNDTLSAYTIDLSTITTSGTSSSIVFSNTSPDPYSYSGNTWIRTTDYEYFIYDTIRGKWLSTNTNQFVGARDRNNQTNVFLRNVDAIPYNLAPYYMTKNSTIVSVVGQTSTSNTFKILLSTGTTLPTDIIYELPIISDVVNIVNTVNVDVYSGSTIYLYMSGTTIDYPKATVYYKNR